MTRLIAPPAEFNPFMFAARLSSSTRECNRFNLLDRYIEFVNETEKKNTDVIVDVDVDVDVDESA